MLTKARTRTRDRWQSVRAKSLEEEFRRRCSCRDRPSSGVRRDRLNAERALRSASDLLDREPPVSRTHGKLWRLLYDVSPVSPYQHYDYVKLWFDAFARERGVEPRIAVAFDCEGTPLALLPFAVGQRLGLRVAEFPCGGESNFNLALLRPGVSFDFRSLLVEAASRSPDGFDLYFLRNQPRRFGGRENPLIFSDFRPQPERRLWRRAFRLRRGPRLPPRQEEGELSPPPIDGARPPRLRACREGRAP